jgi:predicted AAA+ superfamily ATPase
MERKIDEFFIKWKNGLIRKPLIIYGGKQIGKTYSVLNFGKKEYKNVVYFNTHNFVDCTLLHLLLLRNASVVLLNFL